MQGGCQAPPSKGMMSSAVTETCTQLDVPGTARGERGTPPVTGMILLLETPQAPEL